jgi:hypothetical protein
MTGVTEPPACSSKFSEPPQPPGGIIVGWCCYRAKSLRRSIVEPAAAALVEHMADALVLKNRIHIICTACGRDMVLRRAWLASESGAEWELELALAAGCADVDKEAHWGMWLSTGQVTALHGGAEQFSSLRSWPFTCPASNT